MSTFYFFFFYTVCSKHIIHAMTFSWKGRQRETLLTANKCSNSFRNCTENAEVQTHTSLGGEISL